MAIKASLTNIAIIVGIFVLSFQIPPVNRGFNCNDDSIRKPFNQIFYLTKLLFTVSIVIPLLIIFVIERFFSNGKWRRAGLRKDSRPCTKFWFGFLANVTLNEITKKLAGRLRPHTYELCNLQRYCPQGPIDSYISSFTCEQSLHYYYSINTRLSFFSGHSSIGSFSGMYIVLYLHSTLFNNFSRLSSFRRLMIVLLDLFIMAFYLYPGFTQYQIYWHFASDVLTGHTIGIVLAYYIFRFIHN